MKKFILLSAFALFFLAGSAFAQQDTLNVAMMEFGNDIVDRKLMGESTFFESTVGRVYCFTRITGAQDTVKIRHVWFHENDEKERIELEVRSPNWRTWSYKTIPAIWTGDWRVEVWDENNKVLARKTFTVREKNDD